MIFEGTIRRAKADKQHSHGDKAKYGSMILATRAAYNLEQIRHGEIFNPYKCRWCHFYHIGHRRDRSMYNFNFPGEVIKLLWDPT